MKKQIVNILVAGESSNDKHQYITSNDSGSLYKSYINITDKDLYKTPNKKDVIHGQILSTHILRPAISFIIWLYKLYEMFKKNGLSHYVIYETKNGIMNLERAVDEAVSPSFILEHKGASHQLRMHLYMLPGPPTPVLHVIHNENRGLDPPPPHPLP